MIISQGAGTGQDPSAVAIFEISGNGGIDAFAAMLAPVVVADRHIAVLLTPEHQRSVFRHSHQMPSGAFGRAPCDGSVQRDVRSVQHTGQRIRTVIHDDALIFPDVNAGDFLTVDDESREGGSAGTQAEIGVGGLGHIHHDGRIAQVIIQDMIIRTDALKRQFSQIKMIRHCSSLLMQSPTA